MKRTCGDRAGGRYETLYVSWTSKKPVGNIEKRETLCWNWENHSQTKTSTRRGRKKFERKRKIFLEPTTAFRGKYVGEVEGSLPHRK